MLKVLAQLFVLLCTSLAQDVSHTDFAQLSDTPQYDVFWNVTGNRVTFVVVVATTGWVGFGISPNGLMLDSDVIMGHVDDNNAVVEFTVSRQNILRFLLYYTHHYFQGTQRLLYILSSSCHLFRRYALYVLLHLRS